MISVKCPYCFNSIYYNENNYDSLTMTISYYNEEVYEKKTEGNNIVVIKQNLTCPTCNHHLQIIREYKLFNEYKIY